MKLVILKSSPNEFGSSNYLADNFIKGAKESGHEVKVLDVTKLNISPCKGCVRCGYEGPCEQKDDLQILKQELLSCDMVVFVTPLYYYGMTAQLKTVIDRFCSFNSSLTSKRLKSALISVAWNSADWTFEALSVHYKTLVRYLNFEDKGMILGAGCGTLSMTKSSKFPRIAYEFGKNL